LEHDRCEALLRLIKILNSVHLHRILGETIQ
jgi:hypothetical protein